jgi:hypothetical protein
MESNSKPGVCFGFSVTDKPNGDVDVKLAFSGVKEDSTRQSIPDQRNKAARVVENHVDR